MQISEVLEIIGERQISTIDQDSPMEEVILRMAAFVHTRLLYVVDRDNHLKGTITVGALLRHIYPHHYEGKIHPHGLLRRITIVNAAHIMQKKNIFTSPEETVEQALGWMARSGVKEMAVLDQEGRVVGDITAIDLMRCYYKSCTLLTSRGVWQ